MRNLHSHSIFVLYHYRCQDRTTEMLEAVSHVFLCLFFCFNQYFDFLLLLFLPQVLLEYEDNKHHALLLVESTKSTGELVSVVRFVILCWHCSLVL